MIFNKPGSVLSILNESPFFGELSVKEREVLVEDLLKTYPQLQHQLCSDMEVGYEASWLMGRSF